MKKNPKVLIPNIFTGLNMLIGLTSVFYSIKGAYIDAAWLILLSTVMDKLDGTAARFLNASSMFGVEFDSFSDFVSFAIAPSILVFSYYNGLEAGDSVRDFYVVAACAVYIVFSALRLAKYNVMQSDDKDYFYGMTTTMSGGLIAMYMVFAIENSFSWLLDVNIVAGMVFAHSISLLVPFKYPKLKKPKTRNKQFVLFASFALFLGLILTRKLPWLIYLIGVSYVVIGFYKTKKAFSLISINDSDEELDDTETDSEIE
jgi:CDP-diacylglycerol---serine O-phosphatidyltransferase